MSQSYSSPNSTGCLVLAPNATTIPSIPSWQTLLNYLQNSNFIGLPLPARVQMIANDNGVDVDVPLNNNGNNSFYVGCDFLQLITFMGCSPHLQLEPSPNGEPFCYIRLEGIWDVPQLRYGNNTQAPRCSSCQLRIHNWRDLLPLWLAQPQQLLITCPQCGCKQRPIDLRWRKEAGFSHLFVVITNVFPGEAIPVANFLHGLRQHTGAIWDYFYTWE